MGAEGEMELDSKLFIPYALGAGKCGEHNLNHGGAVPLSKNSSYFLTGA